MNRLILTAALFFGATFAAHADVNVWSDMTHKDRSDYVLYNDSDYCAYATGRDLNGVPTSQGMKNCMRARGWRFDHTNLEPWTWHHGNGYGYPEGYRYDYSYGASNYAPTARQD